MKTPPAGFVRTLKSYNKDLRVRWSYEKKKWVIECKASDRRGLLRPVRAVKDGDNKIIERLMPEYSDRYIGYRDGYYAVCFIPELTVRALNSLAACDTQHFKSHESLAQKVEENEAKDEARKERWRQSESYAHSNEVYDYMNNRGSQAFPGGRSL
jgi:hypothetical protein